MTHKFLVLGAGAIGCFVGGMLSASGQDVTLVGRDPLMAHIAANGLTVHHPEKTPKQSRPITATSLELLSGRYDFILLTVKAPAIPAAIEQLQQSPLDLTDSYLVSLQNGIGSEAHLSEAFGAAKVIAATITIPIQVPQLGLIEVSKAKGGLGVAAVNPLTSSTAVKTLADSLNQAELPTRMYDDYQAVKWSKLLLNIVNNATSAILNQPPIGVIADPRLFDVEIVALQEAVAVMQAMGVAAVKLPGYPTDWLAWLMRHRWLPKPLLRRVMRPFMVSGRGSKMPSLQIDLASGRSTSEIDALNGAIVRAGQAHGVATPVNQALTEIMRGLVTGEVEWGNYQGQSERLLGEIWQR